MPYRARKYPMGLGETRRTCATCASPPYCHLADCCTPTVASASLHAPSPKYGTQFPVLQLHASRNHFHSHLISTSSQSSKVSIRWYSLTVGNGHITWGISTPQKCPRINTIEITTCFLSPCATVVSCRKPSLCNARCHAKVRAIYTPSPMYNTLT